MSDLLPDDDWETPSPGTDSAVAVGWLLEDKRGGDEGDGNDQESEATATNASNGSTTTSTAKKKSKGGAWLAGLRSGSRVLARYHDRVWYEAAAEGTVTAGNQLSVRFRGFEDDGPVSLLANSSHLAPLEAGDGGRDGRRRKRGEGGPGASSDSGGGGGAKESDLEDAWADAAGGSGDGDTVSAERFFQERVLGNRREMAGGRGGSNRGGGDGKEGGLCSDAYVFGDWEQHTKGFGSRMMNRMGYRRGEGLGKEKQVGAKVQQYAVGSRFCMLSRNVCASGAGCGGGTIFVMRSMGLFFRCCCYYTNSVDPSTTRGPERGCRLRESTARLLS